MLNETLEGLYLRKIKRRYDEIGRYVYSNVTPIEGIELRETTACEKCENAVKEPGYRPIKVGESWGGNGKSGWFKMSFALPKSFAGKPAAAIIDIGFEGCVFIGCTPYHGVDRFHKEVLLSGSGEAGQKFDLVVEAMSGEFWQRKTEPARFNRADIVTINREVEQYWYALGFLMELAESLPEKSVRRARIIRALNESTNKFDYDHHDEATLRKSAERAYAEIKPVLDKKAEPSALEFTCTGHSHIDTAWLWPYSETIRKCSRTFSTVSRLMEQYPEYHFSQSQPQLYEFTREHYPELYKEIKKWAAAGRWEAVGSMWVEADTNVPSGESLVRQTLFGKRFFEEEFGVETEILWLPDVFGYSGALPQILKKAGVNYFTTIKLIWGNQFNKPPYSSFWWQGIDGTKILAHLPPHGDYNSHVTPAWLRKAQDEYKEKDRSENVLYQFGYGDGGGGPTRQHLEHLELAKDLEGLPKCTQGKGAEFFEKLSEEADTFPTWRGELYFELHRGTYTTQARTKRNNRKSEFALRDAEMLSSVAMSLGGTYSQESLARAWKLVLKNQFHDVIPGSSVPHVYQDAERDYAEVFTLVGEAAANAESYIAGKIDTTGDGKAVVVFNTLSWARDAAAVVGLAEPGSYHIVDKHGKAVPSQVSPDGRTILFTARVPALGYATYRLVKGTPAEEQNPLTVSADLLENDFFRIELDERGLITSIYDKRARREIIPEGQVANLFQLFEDKPLEWDAWDIDFFYQEKCTEITGVEAIEVDQAGPVEGSLKLTRKFGNSKVEQRIVIYPSNPRIDFITKMDWQENMKLLKVAFPVTVNSPTARYEIQFGNLERPTHTSTSWDFAKFEVSGHKWADLSEGGYGVSLMNDCKYGYDVHDGVMRLTLLRAATDPDPKADRGEQVFTYSIFPHEGDYASGGSVRAGYELNVPVRVVVTDSHEGTLPPSLSFFTVDNTSVVLDTVKKAEDDHSLVLRFYEAHNQRGKVTISTTLPMKCAKECDLMEHDLGDIVSCEGAATFDVTPFEIKTIKLA